MTVAKAPKHTAKEKAKATAAANPTTATAALGSVLLGVGHLLGWSADVQVAVSQIILGAAVLMRLGVLAWESAKADLDA